MVARDLTVLRMWMSLCHVPTTVVLLVSLWVSVGAVQGQPARAALSDDPLELAHWAARLGPARVFELLATDASALTRLRAVRALPSLGEPERALQALLPLLQGRDPDLAPAAARAALVIATSVSADLGLRGEVNMGLLRECEQAYREAAGREDLRPDLAFMAMQVAVQLADLT